MVSIDIPNSVTSIGKYVFKECNKLTKIVLPNNLDIINDGTFQLCYALSEVIIPNTVTHIGYKAFWACGQLCSIDIPDSVENIGDCAFQETSLLNLIIPNSVNTIGEDAFHLCRNLKSITLGNGLEHIKDRAFSSCYNLEKITVLFLTPIQISSSVFSSYDKSTLYVAKGTKQLFEKEEPWCFFSNIEEYEKTIAVTLISLNPSSVEGNVGEQIQINATVLPEYATDKVVTWNSSDESVATVDDNGLVYLLKEGTTIITASATDGSEVEASCNVTVFKPEILVSSILLNLSSVEGKEGEQIQIDATVLPEDATDKTIEWSSSDENIATVDDTGLISLLKKGTAVITASATDDSGISAKCAVVVTEYSGIEEILTDKDTYVRIFNLKGILVYEGIYSESNLIPDYYIVVCDGKNIKVKVK